MPRYEILIIAIVCMLFGCSNPADQKKSQQTVDQNSIQENTVDGVINQSQSDTNANGFKRFYVYSDKGSRENHYTPSGFMPNGKCLAFNDTWTDDCQNGKTCIKIVYDVECSRQDQKWAGIYWLNPPNNWGNRKGGFNLEGAEKLTFWAKGELGGEQVQEFTIGGITGNYADSDIAVIGPVILTNEWKQYTIDLRGKDLSYVSGGFSWTTSEEVNIESCAFYLDDIRYE